MFTHKMNKCKKSFLRTYFRKSKMANAKHNFSPAAFINVFAQILLKLDFRIQSYGT